MNCARTTLIRTTSRPNPSPARSACRPRKCSRRLWRAATSTAFASRSCRATALDLKALAKATGDKKIDTVPLKEVEPLTGYIRGGVTALACKKAYPVYLDETATLFPVIALSAGIRGLQIVLAPDDYVRAVNAKVVAIAKDKEPGQSLP